MPHVTLEYTDNLGGFDAHEALARVNAALAASGQFDDADIKSRAVALAQWRIGSAPHAAGFVHVTLRLLGGRPPTVKQALAAALLEAAAGSTGGAGVQVSVEVVDLDRDCYAKTTLGA